MKNHADLVPPQLAHVIFGKLQKVLILINDFPSGVVAIARDQSSRALELRAATSLARLWAEAGDRQKALDLLAPIYGWFSEGFDTVDLMRAQALLNEIA